jgi:hypothetical protein
MPLERSVDPGPSVPFSCLPQLLEHQAKRIPNAPAILAPGRAPLTYGRLYQHIENMGRGLRAMGISIGARYGSTDVAGVSFTEKEHDYAVETKKTVLAFIHGDPGSIPVVKVDTDTALAARLTGFRDKVSGALPSLLDTHDVRLMLDGYRRKFCGRKVAQRRGTLP